GEQCAPGKNVCRGGCASSADCQSGESCLSSTGLCLAGACADDSSCFGGRTCRLQRIPAALAEPSPIFDAAGQLFLYFERADGPAPAAVFRARSLGDADG